MMTIQEKQDEIVSEFEIFDDWMQKYEYLIDLGKDLPLIQVELKTDERLIEGCQSRVWLMQIIKMEKCNFRQILKLLLRKELLVC